MQRYTTPFTILLLAVVFLSSGCRSSRRATQPTYDLTNQVAREAERDSLREALSFLWDRNTSGDPLITSDQAYTYESQNWRRSSSEPYRAPDPAAQATLESVLQVPAAEGLNAMEEEENNIAAILDEALEADSVSVLPPVMEYIEAGSDECYARLFLRTNTLTRRARTIDDMELIRVLCSRDITPSLVRQLQQTFQTMGLYNGPIDGVFAPAVRLAMTRFQRSQGLAWGVLTYETLYALGVDFERQGSTVGLPTGP